MTDAKLAYLSARLSGERLHIGCSTCRNETPGHFENYDCVECANTAHHYSSKNYLRFPRWQPKQKEE